MTARRSHSAQANSALGGKVRYLLGTQDVHACAPGDDEVQQTHYDLHPTDRRLHMLGDELQAGRGPWYTFTTRR